MHHLRTLKSSKKSIFIGIVVIVVIIIAIFIFSQSSDKTFSKELNNADLSDKSAQSAQQEQEKTSEATKEGASSSTPSSPVSDSNNWRNIKLKAVSSQETFTISELSSDSKKPILLESFAVWCPKCTELQKEIQKLKSETDNFIPVSVDTDANEDEQKVKAHIARYGFDWRYAVAQSEFTKSLINEFGVQIINAPSEPVVVLCPSGKTNFLGAGSKSSEKLKQGIDSC